MSLLRTRHQLAVKTRLLHSLAVSLAEDDYAELFISETCFDDVLELAASIAGKALAPEPEDNLDDAAVAEILRPGVQHCLAVLERGELLSQPEHLLLSVAEQWAKSTDNPGNLPELCAGIRELQRKQRRSRMNMGKKTY